MHKRLSFSILLIFATVFVFFFYGKILLAPNEYMFSSSGDGIKNYFTYAYHIKHDSTYTEFEGMNYPYGENYLYTDCHPVIANLLKLLNNRFPSIEKNSIGILNILLIASVFILFIVAYKLLIKLKINNGLSLIFSIGMVMLSPQIFRLTGHYALSYSLAIPLSLLLFLKTFDNKKRIVSLLLLFLSCIFWMFVHAYLGIIVISFLTILWIIYFSTGLKEEKWRKYIYQFIAIILPVILFYLYAVLSDLHTGRTDNPSGFFLYNAELDDILLPHHGIFRELIVKITGLEIKQEWEAWSYIGFPGFIILLVILISLIGSLFKKSIRNFLAFATENRHVMVSLIASLIVMLFALGIPFKQFPVLLDIFPVFKQFRATGRFAWPFFFTFFIFSIHFIQYFFYKWKKSSKLLAYSLIVISSLAYSIEGYAYHKSVSKSITSHKNLFNPDLLPAYIKDAIQNINAHNYTAAVSIPFYHYGSEVFSRPRTDLAMRNSIAVSYHTGLPLFNASLTRISIQESKNIIQLFGPPFYEKAIKDDIPQGANILIIQSPTLALSTYEKNILSLAEKLYNNDSIALYSLSTDILTKRETDVIEYYKSKDTCYKAEHAFCSDQKKGMVYYNSFDTINSEIIFRGEGAFHAIKKGKNILAEFQPGKFINDTTYHDDVKM